MSSAELAEGVIQVSVRAKRWMLRDWARSGIAVYFRGLRRERMFSVQTLKVEETGPRFGWISPDRSRASRMTSEVDGIRRLGDKDAVIKEWYGNDVEQTKFSSSVAWFEDLEGESEEWYLAWQRRIINSTVSMNDEWVDMMRINGTIMHYTEMLENDWPQNNVNTRRGASRNRPDRKQNDTGGRRNGISGQTKTKVNKT